VACQLAYLANCFPRNIRDILNALPATLDETYERTLQEIQETKWESAQQLLVCVTVASRPLLVEELAEVLAFDFKSGATPIFHKDWRLTNPVQAVLSACSTLLSVVNVKTTLTSSQVVQFSHFTVKEFLTSSRFARKQDNLSRRYHISMSPAHTFVAQVCLGVILHLDKNITSRGLKEFPLAEYAARHWFEHARFEGVSQDAVEGMKQLFDRTKPHLSIWLWIYDPTIHFWKRRKRAERPSPPGRNPLHYAAFCGLHEIAKILAIENPQDVNSQSVSSGASPLYLASRGGHVGVARMLVERGADVSAQTWDEWTALHEASEKGHVDVARMLVDCSAAVSAQTNAGWTALHLASRYGYVDLAQMLVERGADVSVQNKVGETALHLALENRHADLVRMLVESGANVSAQNKAGETAIHLASRNGDVDLSWMLVERGADTSTGDKDGWTALHFASEKGRVDCAKMLVERGTDVSAQNKAGETALHLVSRNGHVDLARMLVEHGADMSAQDEDGWTALHLASQEGHVDCAQMLVQRGADVSAQNKVGETALHLASRNGHVDLAQILVERGADMSAQDKDGWTALHFASEKGRVDCAEMLVERGANVSAQNKYGSTALHLASRNGHVYLAQMLVERSSTNMAPQETPQITTTTT